MINYIIFFLPFLGCDERDDEWTAPGKALLDFKSKVEKGWLKGKTKFWNPFLRLRRIEEIFRRVHSRLSKGKGAISCLFQFFKTEKKCGLLGAFCYGFLWEACMIR